MKIHQSQHNRFRPILSSADGAVHLIRALTPLAPLLFILFNQPISKSPMAAPESDKGSHSADLIELLDPTSTAPIDIARLVNHVRDPSAGAIATFEGTTRDTFDGRRVVELRYEAYEPMAIKRLGATCAAAREKWQLIRLAVSHRLGIVPVGEASVFVAVSAVHRADAMEACRYVIDEIKAAVPIWKKEVYEDGEVWKENKEFFETVAGTYDSNNRKKGCCCGSKVRVVEEEETTLHSHSHPHHTSGI